MHPALVVYVAVIGYLRERARELGYALAVHGSLARDIDIIAVPWTDDAVPAAELVEALREKAALAWGTAVYTKASDPTSKPHGRLSWVLMFSPGHVYIDLCVMPRVLPS